MGILVYQVFSLLYAASYQIGISCNRLDKLISNQCGIEFFNRGFLSIYKYKLQRVNAISNPEIATGESI